MSELTRLPGQQISFRDNALDTQATEKFCLVAICDRERFSLAVLDNLTNDFLAYESWYYKKAVTQNQIAEQLDRMFTDHGWILNGFKRVDVIVTTELFTVVPSSLFDSSSSRKMLEFNVPVPENFLIQTDILRQADARIIYALDPKLEKVLSRLSGAVRIRHHLTPLIEKSLSQSKNKKSRTVFVNVRQDQFDLIAGDNGKLLLANVFEFHSAEDFIYYILFAAEQLKLNPEEFELHIAGEVEEDSALINIARKYIRNVIPEKREAAHRFAKGFDQFPEHFHYNLFALHFFS